MEPQSQKISGGAETLKHMAPGSSVSIAYHPNFGPHDDLIILELDEKLVPDVLNERMVLRGQPDEDAVLCTRSKTYAMKFVGTSNSVLLVPPADKSESYENLQTNDSNNSDEKVVANVIKVVPGNMELIEVSPRLDKLRLLLSENTYRFDENDMETLEDNQESRTGLYSWDDLIDNIQASDEELRFGLQALSAVEINGYWRLVDESYMDMILGMLLKNVVLNDWSLNALNEDEVVNMLESDGFPLVLARHCLHVYGKQVKENDCIESCLWKLDEKRVCIHFAREILKGGKRKLESFMDEWRNKTPDEMHPTFDLMEGEVLTEKIGVETWVRAFRVSSLPSTPAERFSILFRERAKWDWKDLQPYIRDLNVPGLSAEGILLKYTRKTQPSPNEDPVFSAR
ncbi:sister chromatid cohesion protein DCC1 [Trifolium pratense]|uniref:Sister chromatid cohesion protein DCC1 n=1 Tax=Trifolium pratense TaxID=57577 RepID=A0A2K3PFF6_TRIPR|nr:sister chromatid cohesion protein DCC1 [Trifolium pratense]